MDTEEADRREIIEQGLQRIAAAREMVSHAGHEIREADAMARSGAAMIAHMAAQSVADQPKPKGQKRPRKAKRPDHHR